MVLERAGATLDPKNSAWEPVLYYAASHKRVGVIKQLLNGRFDADALYMEAELRPLLMTLIAPMDIYTREGMLDKHKIEGIRVLVYHGANVDAMDTHGWTALGWATCLHGVEVAKELIRLGANPLASADYTMNALYVAFADESPNSLQLLEMYLREVEIGKLECDFAEMFGLGKEKSVEKGEELEEEHEGENPEEVSEEVSEEDAEEFSEENSEEDAQEDEEDEEEDEEENNGLSQLEWLEFHKMKLVKKLYWRNRYPVPGP